MIVVYRGKLSQVNQKFGSKVWTYKQGVPSYMSENHFRSLKGEHFIEFDPKTFTQVRGGQVLLYIPSHPALAIAAMYAAEKVRMSYPTCRIDAVFHPSIARILPDWITPVMGQVAEKNYTQVIDLRPAQRHLPSDPRVIQHAPDYRRLALIAGGLDEPKDDHQVANWVPSINGWAPSGRRVGIVAKTEGFRSVVPIGAELILPALEAAGLEPYFIQYEDETLADGIDAVLECRVVLALADSPLTYVAGAMGIPTLTFKHKAATLDYSRHYRYLPSIHAVSLAESNSPEGAAAIIVAACEKAINGQPAGTVDTHHKQRGRRGRATADMAEVALEQIAEQTETAPTGDGDAD